MQLTGIGAAMLKRKGVPAVLILLLSSILAACWSDRMPVDAALVERFFESKSLLQELLDEAMQDSSLLRVAPDFILVKGQGEFYRGDQQAYLSKERWDRYLELFDKLGLNEGLLRRDSGDQGIYFIAYSTGLVSGGVSKGYVYSEKTLEPVVSDLDEVRRRGEGIFFKRLNRKWYLFLEISG